MFWCPGCNERHMIYVHGSPKGPRWDWNGDTESPTFSPSILVHGNPAAPICHSFVRGGNIQFLGDCSHALAGQTVELPDFPEGI